MNPFLSALQAKSRQIKKAVEKRPPPLNQLRLQLESYRLAALRKRCRALPVTAMPLFLLPLLGVS